MEMRNPFRLVYLPLFQSDLNEIIDYISVRLENPQAALDLVVEVEKAILERAEFPLSFAPIPSSANRENPYYAIIVKNYAVFYVVIGNVMEIRRIIYKGRDFPKLLP